MLRNKVRNKTYSSTEKVLITTGQFINGIMLKGMNMFFETRN